MKASRRGFLGGLTGVLAASGAGGALPAAASAAKGQRWVDLQVNGRVGVSFTDDSLTVEGVKKVTDALNAADTEYFLPTIVTCPDERAVKGLRTIRAAMKTYPECQRSILGFHMEGPFVTSVPGYSGAHNRQWVRDPDTAVYDRWMDASDGLVRLVTICGMRKGAEEFARYVSAKGTVVSLGHTHLTKTEDIDRMVKAGVKAWTHLGNAMPNEVPRHNNQIWTALAHRGLTPMFISDGFHLPKEMLRVFVRSRPLDELITVSDCSFPGGLEPGSYWKNGRESILEPNGFIRSPSTNSLGGSSCLMRDCVKTLNSPEVGLSLGDCGKIARINPLRLIGMEALI